MPSSSNAAFLSKSKSKSKTKELAITVSNAAKSENPRPELVTAQVRAEIDAKAADDEFFAEELAMIANGGAKLKMPEIISEAFENALAKNADKLNADHVIMVVCAACKYNMPKGPKLISANMVNRVGTLPVDTLVRGPQYVSKIISAVSVLNMPNLITDNVLTAVRERASMFNNSSLGEGRWEFNSWEAAMIAKTACDFKMPSLITENFVEAVDKMAAARRLNGQVAAMIAHASAGLNKPELITNNFEKAVDQIAVDQIAGAVGFNWQETAMIAYASEVLNKPELITNNFVEAVDKMAAARRLNGQEAATIARASAVLNKPELITNNFVNAVDQIAGARLLSGRDAAMIAHASAALKKPELITNNLKMALDQIAVDQIAGAVGFNGQETAMIASAWRGLNKPELITNNFEMAVDQTAGAGGFNGQGTAMIARASAGLNKPQLITNNFLKAVDQNAAKKAAAGGFKGQETAMIENASARLKMPKLITEGMRWRSAGTPDILNVLCELKVLSVGSNQPTLDKDLFSHPMIKTRMRMLKFDGDIDAKMSSLAIFLGYPSEYKPLLEMWRRAEKDPNFRYIFVSSDMVEVVIGVIERQRRPSRKNAPYVRNESSATEFFQGMLVGE